MRWTFVFLVVCLFGCEGINYSHPTVRYKAIEVGNGVYRFELDQNSNMCRGEVTEAFLACMEEFKKANPDKSIKSMEVISKKVVSCGRHDSREVASQVMVVTEPAK